MAKWVTDDGEQTPESLAASMVSHPEAKPKTGKAKKTAKPNGQSALPAEETQPKTKPVKKQRETRPTCTSKKKDGTPCTAHAMAGVTWCTDHRPAHQHLTAEEMAKVVAWVCGGEADEDSQPDAFRDQLPQELAEAIVALMGWGQVREAIRKGRL